MAKSWKRLFLNKNFIYIWLSQILSQITLYILNFVFLFTLFEKTQSTIATSLIWISFAIPAVIIGPFASASVDMIDRKKLLNISNILQSLVVLLYALAFDTSYFVIYAVVMIYSSINQFYVPAELSTIPYVTKKRLLPEANGIFLLTQQGSLIIGFGVAGLFLKYLGFQNTLILCSAFLFAAFLSTLFLPRMKPHKKVPSKFEKAVFAYFKNIYSGYKFITQKKFILAPLVILVCMQISLTVVAVNIPALASEVFEIPLNYAGAFIIVPGGVGAFLASVRVSKLLNKGKRKIKIIKNSLICLSLSLFVWIFVFSYLSHTLRIILSLATVCLMGYLYIGILIPTQTFLQQKTPLEFRGRVFGNYWFLVTIISVFPVIVSGTITEIFGSRILMAILIIGITGLYLFLKNKERKYLLPEGYN